MRRLTISVLAGLLLMAPPGVSALALNSYQLTGSLSAGGGRVSGGSYQIGASLGQADAGESSGGGYTLGGGIFGGGQVAPPPSLPRSVYLPLARK